MSQQEPISGQDPGWYPYFNGVRFFNGQEWTEDYAYVPPGARTQMGIWEVSLAVFAGVMAAFIVVWVGAQLAPDDIFFPVKFVVEDLPDGLR